jgi:hypothetical protein
VVRVCVLSAIILVSLTYIVPCRICLSYYKFVDRCVFPLVTVFQLRLMSLCVSKQHAQQHSRQLHYRRTTIQHTKSNTHGNSNYKIREQHAQSDTATQEKQ